MIRRPLCCRALILAAILILLTHCVRYEDQDDDQPQKQTGQAALDEIREQLEHPLRQPRARTTPEKIEKPADARNLNSTTPNTQLTTIAEIAIGQSKVPWPPRIGAPFPRMQFLTPSLQRRSLDEFRGRVVVIEYVSMASAVTQAFAGSRDRGPFGSSALRNDFKPLESYFPEYSGGIPSTDVILVQILMLDHHAQPVSTETAAAWNKHFELEARGRVILIASPVLLRNQGSEVVGGFQMLDKNGVVRADATGERSKTLFSELFPGLARYVRANI